MDEYITTYLPERIANNIYLYVGWHNVYEYSKVSDDFWRQIYELSCQDPQFEQMIKYFFAASYPHLLTYKYRFCEFVNSLVHTNDLNNIYNKIPYVLCEDRSFIIFACRQNAYFMMFAKKQFTADIAIAYEILPSKGLVLKYLSRELQVNRELALLAIKQNPDVIRSIERLQLDRMMVLEAVRLKGIILERIHTKFSSDPEIVTIAVQQSFHSFRYVHESLKSNKQFVLSLLKLRWEIWQYLSYALQHDYDILTLILPHITKKSYSQRQILHLTNTLATTYSIP